jgi:hypothetical protein
MLVLAASAFPE